MAEKKQHAFNSPELHWLNNYLGSSDTLKRNTFVQNLHGIPVNQGNENRNLVAHGNSSKPSSHMSHGRSPTGKGTNIQNGLLVGIMNATTRIATATALAPIERVNIMMQCQNEMIKAGCLSTPYKGMTYCLLRTVKHEGVISLWRGNSMNVISVCVREALLSGLYYLPIRDYMNTKIKESPLPVLPFIVMPLLLCDYPLKYARIRLACDIKADKRSKFSLDFSRNNIGKRQFNGAIDVYKKTLQLDGIHGLYRGFSVSCIGLWAHYVAKRFIPISSKEKHNQKKPTRLALIITGCILYFRPAVFYPFVTVSRRMMMTSGEANNYQGAMDAFYKIVKTEGVSSLFKGLTPFMIHTIARDFIMLGYLSVVFLQLQKPAK